MACKLQLRQELNNIQQQDMSITDYTPKMKEICDTLDSINVTVDEDKMVKICLGGLAQRYRPIWTVICTREKQPSFVDLKSMLIFEENHTCGLRTTQSDNRMLYTEADWSVACRTRWVGTQ